MIGRGAASIHLVDPGDLAILILDYLRPDETVECVRLLPEVEGAGMRVLWIENDARTTLAEGTAVMQKSWLPWVTIDMTTDELPVPGFTGYIPRAGCQMTDCIRTMRNSRDRAVL